MMKPPSGERSWLMDCTDQSWGAEVMQLAGGSGRVPESWGAGSGRRH